MTTFSTNSSGQTRKFASQFIEKYKTSGVVIALSGKLGAGKTTFVQGLAEGLGIEEKILSPTFVLMRQHQIPFAQGCLIHIDLYRLEKGAELKETGISEIIENGNVVVIEWPERLTEQLPVGTIEIRLEIISNNRRRIIIS